MLQVFLEGFLLQASLIFALGAQNLFVMESGIRRHYHLTVSFVCFLCDLTLIMLGVAGAATLFHHFPEVKVIFGVLGIAFLLWYGLDKLTNREQILIQDVLKEKGLRNSILKAITFSIINPHAYLDGIVLIGGYSSKYPMLQDRLAVGLGASFCSLVWFLLLSTAASTMMPLFQNPRRMRLVMSTAGLFLLFLSARLSIDVYGWVVDMLQPVAADPTVIMANQ
jgi:L-lysine exporter family protein LysE/ArgO